MNGSRLARGPMGGDQFTQIHNGVFRDARLSPKAMGVFGHLSTHAPGWYLTAESIARAMRSGPDAVKGALQELERYHYLIRTRERHGDGTLGDSVYWYTDLPAQLAAVGITDPNDVARHVRDTFNDWLAEQNPRSQPGGENPPLDVTCDDARLPSAQPKADFPTLDYPARVNPPPKNTKGKNTNGKKTNSSSGAPPAQPVDVELPPLEEEEQTTANHNGDGTTSAARDLLSSLPDPWRLGPKAVERLTPLTARALRDGWDPDRLAEQLSRNPHGVQHPERCLQSRLGDLPAPPTVEPAGREEPDPVMTMIRTGRQVEPAQPNDVFRAQRAAHGWD